MKTTSNNTSETRLASTIPVSEAPLAAGLIYRELNEIPVEVQDPVLELRQNLERLDELQARFSFVVREIRSQIKG